MYVLLFFILVSPLAYSNCPVQGIQNFITQNNLMLNPDYTKLKNMQETLTTSYDCIERELFNLSQLLRLRQNNIASIKKCYDYPTPESCDLKFQEDYIRYMVSLNFWEDSLRKNKHFAFEMVKCKDSIIDFDEEKAYRSLNLDTGKIFQFLAKKKRDGSSLQTPDLVCGKEYSVDANDSPNIDHYKKLYEEYKKHKNLNKVDLKDLLISWYPQSEKKLNSKAYYEDCQSDSFGYFNKWDIDKDEGVRYLTSDCSPDVLYSWGPKKKLNNIEKTLLDEKQWDGDPNPHDRKYKDLLYTASSPVSTFGYGEVSVRIKVKEGTPFQNASHKEIDGKIGTRSDGNFNDFSISDASVIESWSYGTPEHYDEIIRAVKRVMTGKRALVYKPGYSHLSGEQRLYTSADGHDFSEETLKRNLLKHMQLILNKQGKIVFQKGSCKNQYLHFGTVKKTSFNQE